MRNTPFISAVLLALVVVPGTSGCATVTGRASPADPRPAGWSVAAAVSWLPASALPDDPAAMVVVGDLDAATDLAGATRPTPSADADEVFDWAMAIAGPGPGSRVWTDLPRAASPDHLRSNDEITAELGWSLLTVHAFAEVWSPPSPFSVLAGDFDADDLTAAVGEPVDGIWRLGPAEDGAIDIGGATPARPLGEALRMGLSDSRLAVARGTAPVRDWLAGGEDLGDHPTLAPLAHALDTRDVYSATLVPEWTRGATDGIDGVDDADLPLPFDAVAIGTAVDDAGPLLVIAYHHDDEQAAAANVDRIRAVAADGSSERRAQPWPELLELVEISADGAVATATFRFPGDPRPQLGQQLLLTYDTLLQHG